MNQQKPKMPSDKAANSSNKEPSKGISARKIRWIAVGLVLLIVIIIIAVLIGQSKTDKNSSGNPFQKNTTETTQQGRTLPSPQEYTTAQADHLYYEPGPEGLVLEGLYSVKLKGDKKPTMHYFTAGKIDPSYTGLALLMNANKPQKYGDYSYMYYVKNGKVDSSFNGLVSYDNYLRVVENGRVRADFTGKLHLPDGDYDVKNGAVYGYALGQPDNFQWNPVFWYLDGEPVAYHK